MHKIKKCGDEVPLIRVGAHAKDTASSLEIFISYKSEIVILRYRFSFFTGGLSPACIHQQGARECGEPGYSSVWRLINKAGRQRHSEWSRFLCDSCAAIEHGP